MLYPLYKFSEIRIGWRVRRPGGRRRWTPRLSATGSSRAERLQAKPPTGDVRGSPQWASVMIKPRPGVCRPSPTRKPSLRQDAGPLHSA